MSGKSLTVILLGAMALSMTGCSNLGNVEQGRVIAYDRTSGKVTLILDSSGAQITKPVYDVLPPISVKAPDDPDEMGPPPVAGKLMKVNLQNRTVVVYDAAANSFRTIPYTLIEEKHNVPKAGALPTIDKAKHTITVYSREDKTAVTFAASDEMLAMPADTWKGGDEVRYYFKDPAQALRMMNVTRTDLSKS